MCFVGVSNFLLREPLSRHWCPPSKGQRSIRPEHNPPHPAMFEGWKQTQVNSWSAYHVDANEEPVAKGRSAILLLASRWQPLLQNLSVLPYEM